MYLYSKKPIQTQVNTTLINYSTQTLIWLPHNYYS